MWLEMRRMCQIVSDTVNTNFDEKGCIYFLLDLGV